MTTRERHTPLWSERHGRGPRAEPLELPQARRLFASVVAEFDRRGWFQEAFGYECVDAGFVPGRTGEAVEETILLETGRDNVWPISQYINDWDEDTLLDMVEYFHHNVSAGVEEEGYFHSFAGCGWHFQEFDADRGRREYREQVNRFLPLYEDGFELSENGAVERLLGEGFADLIEPPPDGDPLPEGDEETIRRALREFRSRNLRARRDAVRDLADVLERNRATIERHMFRRDEDALYEIANKYWIRHNKPEERRDYNHDAWWDWIFHLYLSSIRLVQRLGAANAADEQ